LKSNKIAIISFDSLGEENAFPQPLTSTNLEEPKSDGRRCRGTQADLVRIATDLIISAKHDVHVLVYSSFPLFLVLLVVRIVEVRVNLLIAWPYAVLVGYTWLANGRRRGGRKGFIGT
jgi:hypothetical protein